MKTATEFLGKIFYIDVLLLTMVFANEPVRQFTTEDHWIKVQP